MNKNYQRCNEKEQKIRNPLAQDNLNLVKQGSLGPTYFYRTRIA